MLDAANLDNHLRFALEVIALGQPVVVALNMMDLAERDGLVLDPAKLEQALGVPVIPTVAVRRRGLEDLSAAVEKPSQAQAGRRSDRLSHRNAITACANRQSGLPIRRLFPKPLADAGQSGLTVCFSTPIWDR